MTPGVNLAGDFMRRLTSFIVLALVAAGCGSAEGVAGSSSATTLAGGTGEQTPIVIPDTTARQPGPTSPAPRLPADLPDSDFPRRLAPADWSVRGPKPQQDRLGLENQHAKIDVPAG